MNFKVLNWVSWAVLPFVFVLGCGPDNPQAAQTGASLNTHISERDKNTVSKVADVPTDDDVLQAGQSLASETKIIVDFGVDNKDTEVPLRAQRVNKIRRSKEPFGDAVYRVEFELTVALPMDFDFSKGLSHRSRELEMRSPSLNKFMKTNGFGNSRNIPFLIWDKAWHELYSGQTSITFQIGLILRKWDDGWRTERLLN